MLCILLAVLLPPLKSAAAPTAQDLHFAIISDMNEDSGDTQYSADLRKAIAAIVQTPTELVLSTGDMVAGMEKGLNYKRMWAAFHSLVTDPLLAAGIKFAPSPGNHDAATGEKFKVEREEYVRTFNAKIPGQFDLLPGSNFPLRYAFIYKNVLFIAYDATSIGALSKTQMAWIADTVTAHPNVRAKFLFGHMPLHPFAHNRTHEHMAAYSKNFALEFEEFLEKNKVTALLTGHHHTFYSGHRNGFTKYISSPLLGGGRRKLLQQSTLSPKGFLLFKYSDARGLEYRMVATATMTDVGPEALPPALNLPAVDAKDCVGCAAYPKELFIDAKNRTLYLRQEY